MIANFGWRTHTVSNGENVYKLDQNMFTDEKLSAALGVLGMPGYVCYTSVLNVAVSAFYSVESFLSSLICHPTSGLHIFKI